MYIIDHLSLMNIDSYARKSIEKQGMLTFKDSSSFKMDPSTAKTLLSITIICQMLNRGLRIFKWKLLIIGIKNRVIRQARWSVLISERPLRKMNIMEKIMTKLSRAILPLPDLNEVSAVGDRKRDYCRYQHLYFSTKPTKHINFWSIPTVTCRCLLNV